jgi:hypothetical protein
MPQTSAKIHSTGKLSYTVLVLAVVLIWLSLVLQFCISVPKYMHSGYSSIGAVVQLLSYFTIQSNLLAGIGLSTLLFSKSTTSNPFFARGYVLTGIALYIIIVGLVYNIVLRSLWHPNGLFKLADELMHLVNPVVYVAYWLFFIPKEKLKWAQSLNWLWFPCLYLIYILIRGAISHLYPYPFINADTLGYERILINSLLLLVVFLILGLLLILIARSLSEKQYKTNKINKLHTKNTR